MTKKSHFVTAGNLAVLPQGTRFDPVAVRGIVQPDDGPTYPPPGPPYTGQSYSYPIVKLQEAGIQPGSTLAFKIESETQSLLCIIELEEIKAASPTRRLLTNFLGIEANANQNSVLGLDGDSARFAQQLFQPGNVLKLYVHYASSPPKVTLGTLK